MVSLAVYSYFGATLLGRQWLDPNRVDVKQVDYVFPFFTVLQFLFYVGWLKVREQAGGIYGNKKMIIYHETGNLAKENKKKSSIRKCYSKR